MDDFIIEVISAYRARFTFSYRSSAQQKSSLVEWGLIPYFFHKQDVTFLKEHAKIW